MSWIDKNKGAGPWDFTERGDVFGYLNNKRWSSQTDAIAFCQARGLSLDLPNKHHPCSHWHKAEASEEIFPAGRWVAAMQQPGTPYIYVYDILYKAVIRINTSEIPVFVDDRLELDSAYALDYDVGQGNPGGQRGGYCMNKDGTRIWYLFCDQGQNHHDDYPDAQLIEVDISKTEMSIVRKTIFSGLIPLETWPDYGKVNDGCSDNTHTYWCTDLVAGRIIKIRNSDHSIIDDHLFNYALECGGSLGTDEGIATIDVDINNGKLYWVYCRSHYYCVPQYNVCRHLIRATFDLAVDIEDISCGHGLGSPGNQNMIRVYSGHVLHHRAYHPSDGPFMKWSLDLSREDTVAGTASWQWACIKEHVASVSNRPQSGADWSSYWGRYDEQPGGNVWQAGKIYHNYAIIQNYLQNILGVKDGKIFTLMHTSGITQPGFLYCIDFSGMTEVFKLEVNYYTGQGYLKPYDWQETSVSAMNQQTGVIAIFRYHNDQKRNHAGCFDASSDLELLCDVSLHTMRHTNVPVLLSEPQIWTMPG